MIAFLKQLAQSFYDGAFYRNLALTGKGWGIGFLIVATLLNVVPMARAEQLEQFFKNKKEILAALPTMTLKNGTLSVDAPTPLRYDLVKVGPDITLQIVIDPAADMTDQAALLRKMESEHIVLLAGGRSLALFDKAAQKITLTPYDATQDRDFTRKDWADLNAISDLFLGSGLLALLLGFGFLAHLTTSAGGALLIGAVAPFWAQKLPFDACMRLAAAAKIPVATVALLATPHLGLQSLIWIGFAAFGLLSIRARKAVGNGPEIS